MFIKQSITTIFLKRNQNLKANEYSFVEEIANFLLNADRQSKQFSERESQSHCDILGQRSAENIDRTYNKLF